MNQDQPVRQDSGATEPNRRRFVDRLLGVTTFGMFGAILHPVLRYLYPPPASEASVNTVTLPMRASDIPANSGRIFKFGDRPGILVRTPGGELRAFSARCTHLNCTVQYREDISQIWCACHNGLFDLNGGNAGGPPPAPLESYVVRVRGEEVVVTRS
ncbi:MAG: Rieske (2Fe-2S) protein [Gemmatimonadota bacterium]|nr:Rieske (2Fe-2S) protein [Gemmatimonadota bacterium]